MAILHVEDQAVIRDVVRRALEARGFTVVSADGVAAAKQAVLERDDLVGALLDIRLRDGNGIELYEWIAVNRPRLAACVAFVTGSTDADTQEALPRLGCPILAKPFEIADLWDLATHWERPIGPSGAIADFQERRIDA
jgi:CheY-like chemotaxis protein